MILKIRQYIYYDYIKPRINKPLALSIATHILLALSLLNVQQEPYTLGTLEVELSGASINNEVLVDEKEIEKQNKDTSGNPDNIDTAAFQKENHQNVHTTNSTDFEKDFEESLFTKKRNINSKNNQGASSKKGTTWVDEKIDPIKIEKRQTGEKLNIPGEVNYLSGKTKWTKGFSRVLVKKPRVQYPLYFRKQGIQGTVKLRINVNSKGVVTGSEIIKSSGHTKLDILARKGVLSARYKPDPGAVKVGVAEVIISFKLKE